MTTIYNSIWYFDKPAEMSYYSQSRMFAELTALSFFLLSLLS